MPLRFFFTMHLSFGLIMDEPYIWISGYSQCCSNKSALISYRKRLGVDDHNDDASAEGRSPHRGRVVADGRGDVGPSLGPILPQRDPVSPQADGGADRLRGALAALLSAAERRSVVRAATGRMDGFRGYVWP